jgi:hypothetical protein
MFDPQKEPKNIKINKKINKNPNILNHFTLIKPKIPLRPKLIKIKGKHQDIHPKSSTIRPEIYAPTSPPQFFILEEDTATLKEGSFGEYEYRDNNKKIHKKTTTREHISLINLFPSIFFSIDFLFST